MAIDANASVGVVVGRNASAPNDDPFTMLGWVKLNADLNAFGWLCLISDGTNLFGPSVEPDGVTLGITNSEDLNTSSNRMLALGSWYHVAVTRNGASLRLWLNGEVVAVQNLGTAFTPAAILLFADNVGANPSDCSWSHLRVWESELSQAEILAEIHEPVAKKASPWAAWEFASGSLNDTSGNGRHMTTFAGSPIADTDPQLQTAPVAWFAA